MTKSFTAVRVVQIAIGTLAVAGIFITTREWFGRRAAWAAAAAAALCGVFTFYEVLLLQASVDTALTAAGLCALTFALGGERRAGLNARGWFVVAGVIFAIQTLNRPNVLLPAVGFVVILAALRRVKPAVYLAVGLLLGLTPVAARNLVVSGQWSLVSSHGGLNYFIGNHAGASGFYEFVPGVRPGIEGQREDTQRVAEAALGRRLTDAEVSDYFLGLGRDWALAHPWDFVTLSVRKFLYTFHADHVPLPFGYPFYATDAHTILRVLIVNAWVLVPLGVTGLVLCAPRDRRADWLVWASFVPVYAVAVAIFFVAERYRLPLFVPYCVGAGALIDRGATVATSSGGTRGRWLAGAGATVAVLLVLVQWPLALSDSREGDRVRMAAHAAETGEFAQADRWAALAVHDSTAPAAVESAVGHALLAAKQPARAIGYLQSARSRGSRDPQLLIDLATALRDAGRPAEALAALQTIDFSATHDEALRLKAGNLAAELGDAGLAERLFREVVRVRPDLADAWAQLGFTLLARGQVDEAATALGEAARRNPRDPVALGGLAVAELKLGRRDDALTHARAALVLDAHEPLASQVLAALGGGRS